MDAKSANCESCLLPPSLNAPGLARDFVATALSNWGVEATFSDVALVTSELVTNAVRHAHSNVGVTIGLDADGVRIEVDDRSAQAPVMRDLDSARDGGWGMHIVESLATRWGLEPRPDGKTIWFEIAAPSSPTGGQGVMRSAQGEIGPDGLAVGLGFNTPGAG